MPILMAFCILPVCQVLWHSLCLVECLVCRHPLSVMMSLFIPGLVALYTWSHRTFYASCGGTSHAWSDGSLVCFVWCQSLCLVWWHPLCLVGWHQLYPFLVAPFIPGLLASSTRRRRLRRISSFFFFFSVFSSSEIIANVTREAKHSFLY